MTSSARERMLDAAVAHFAEHGVEDQSLRAIAAGIGSSHRMVIYHFGSREGLLAEVVGAVEAQQRAALTELTASVATAADARAALSTFWSRVLEAGLRHGPLFFELSVHAMRDEPHARALRDSLVDPWVEALTLVLDGIDGASSGPAVARLGVAVARGLIHDALLTGDLAAVDDAMSTWIALVAGPSTETP